MLTVFVFFCLSFVLMAGFIGWGASAWGDEGLMSEEVSWIDYVTSWWEIELMRIWIDRDSSSTKLGFGSRCWRWWGSRGEGN